VNAPRVSVAARLMLLMAALAGVSIGLALALQDRALWQDLESAAASRLEEAAAGSERLLADHLRAQAARKAAVARTPEFRANLETGHRATLLHHARSLGQREGAAAVVFLHRDGGRIADAGDPAVARALVQGFTVDPAPNAIARLCVTADGAGRLPNERFAPCVSDTQTAQATLVQVRGAVFVATSVPLVTRERRVGTLLAAEPLATETLAAWSELTGATLAFAEPEGTAQAPLVRTVLHSADLLLRAGSSMERERATLHRARRNLVGVGFASLVLAMAASAMLARGFVRPIQEIRRATERVGEGEFTARLDIPRNDEIGDVAQAFNEALRRLHASDERLRVAQRLARFGDWALDPETGTLEGSPEFWRIVGIDSGEKRLAVLLGRVHEEDCEALESALGRCGEAGHAFRLEVRTTGAPTRVLQIQAQRVGDERRGARVEASVQDVTEQRSVERQIRYLAYHDSLTGLGNRRFFEERLALALAEARRRREPLAVLFLDLDRFKGINDSLGHSTGDALLQEVASRLLGELQTAPSEHGAPEPAVSRLGGDEFMILLPAPTDADAARVVGHGILHQISQPIRVDGASLVVTGSIGIAIWPDDGSDMEALLRSSDTAMYDAKSSGPNQIRLCTESLILGAKRRLQVEMRLREALGRDDLELHYQPRVDALSSRILGFEALLRWRDPELGVVSPVDFVPIAEDAGLIRSLGRWVLRCAAAQTQAWCDEGFGDLVVSVNLSPRQLHPDFVQTFDEVLEETGLDPTHIELEVTESAVVEQTAQAVEVLQALRLRGARIALDDFGTGYSSFSTLRELPIDAFKIDRSFVKPMAQDEDAAALVAAMVSMARVLRLRVVAEGVEEESQQELLQEMGCDELQGFLFGQATAAPEAGRLLAQRPRPKRRRQRG
jgi:diguanylate cyclase (GGDEF)-like protein